MCLRFFLTFLLSAALVSTTRGADRLHDITTIEDLRRLEPVHLDDDWDVRVGLAEGGKDAGPWRVLYCLATYRKEGQPSRPPNDAISRGESLGPLSYHVGEDRSAIKEVMGGGLSQLNSREPKEYLYAAFVPLPVKGSYPVKVMRPDGPEGGAIFEGQIDIEEPEPSMWREFTESMPQGGGYLSVKPDGVPACPRAASSEPMVCFDAVGPAMLPNEGDRQVKRLEREPDAADQERGDNERANNLPGGIPLAPQWQNMASGSALIEERAGRNYPLKLVLEKNIVFIITSPAKIFADTDEKFLVRWWVNAKPITESVRGPESRVYDSVSISRMRDAMESGDTVRVVMRLPDYLGKLAEGDVVRVQVLYCPQGYEPLSTRGLAKRNQILESRGDARPTFPLQSNSVSFEVTAAMLKAREQK